LHHLRVRLEIAAAFPGSLAGNRQCFPGEYCRKTPNALYLSHQRLQLRDLDGELVDRRVEPPCVLLVLRRNVAGLRGAPRGYYI
jgi:hypothetical protein